MTDHLAGRSIVTQHVVEMPVIERREDEVMELRQLVKIANEADGIELRGAKRDFDLVIVAVQPAARMVGRKSADDMRGGKGEAARYGVHAVASEPAPGKTEADRREGFVGTRERRPAIASHGLSLFLTG